MKKITLDATIVRVNEAMSLKPGDELVVYDGNVLGLHKRACEPAPDATYVGDREIISYFSNNPGFTAFAMGNAMGYDEKMRNYLSAAIFRLKEAGKLYSTNAKGERAKGAKFLYVVKE